MSLIVSSSLPATVDHMLSWSSYSFSQRSLQRSFITLPESVQQSLWREWWQASLVKLFQKAQCLWSGYAGCLPTDIEEGAQERLSRSIIPDEWRNYAAEHYFQFPGSPQFNSFRRADYRCPFRHVSKIQISALAWPWRTEESSCLNYCQFDGE